MQVQEGFFTDVDEYNEFVKNWDLTFNLLSKSDFSAQLKMILNNKFSLVWEKLNGKIEQKGKTQPDFIVFGFGVNDTSFYWFDEKVGTNDLIIFPKENNFEVVSYDNHEVYVISIHKELFFNSLKKVGISRSNILFNGKSHMLFLSKSFSSRFTKLLDYFLNSNLNNKKKNEALIETVVSTLIEYLFKTDKNVQKAEKNKKVYAVKKAVKIINNQVDDLYSIKQLCAMVGVSEGTLLNAFKEKYKVTPSEYIKAFRLNKVKHEIYNNKGKPIFEIAGKYNFWHMGQFAKDFKKQFGILPSEV